MASLVVKLDENDENRRMVSITAGITAMQVLVFFQEKNVNTADHEHLKCSSFQVQIKMQDSSTFPLQVVRLLPGGS